MKGIKNIRLKNYDYSKDGYYFITIASHDRVKFSENESELIKKEVLTLSRIEGVSVDLHILMSNHVHLIMILYQCDLKLGEVVRKFKAKTSKLAGRKLWQPNYYEHVIRDESALNRIREYIQNNPESEQIKFEQFYK